MKQINKTTRYGLFCGPFGCPMKITKGFEERKLKIITVSERAMIRLSMCAMMVISAMVLLPQVYHPKGVFSQPVHSLFDR